MDDDQITRQEPQEEQTDSFLSGFDEDGGAPAGAQRSGSGGEEEGQRSGAEPLPEAAAKRNGFRPDEGWDETSSEPEENASVEDGGDQAKPQAEEQEPGEDQAGDQAAPSGDSPDGGTQPAGDPAKQPDGEDQPAQPPRTWTLNHMGQPVVISEADVPVLAQKGLDYDRIRAVYDEARPVMDLFRDFARQAGISVQEYVGLLRTQAKEAQGLDREAARRAVELEDREARIAAQEAEDRHRQEVMQQARAIQRQRHDRIMADVQEFLSVYPDAARDFQSIPQEVWDAVNGGMSLVAAYARYNNAQAAQSAQTQEDERQRLDAARQQAARNAAASTGSMKSAGQNHGPKDPFLEGWDDD